MTRKLPDQILNFIGGDESRETLDGVREYLKDILAKRSKAGIAARGKSGRKITVETPEAKLNRERVRAHRKKHND